MPGIRENSMAKKPRPALSVMNEPAEMTSLRRQPTEELNTSTVSREVGGVKGARTNEQSGGRKSLRHHATQSVRAATLKLKSRTHTNKSLASSDAGLSQHTKTKQFLLPSRPRAGSSKRADKTGISATKTKSLPTFRSKLSNGPTSLLTTKSSTGKKRETEKVANSLKTKKQSSLVAKASGSHKLVMPCSHIDKATKQLWFPGNVFLAVRASDDDQFYLCRSRRCVYNTTRTVPVTWLTLRNKPLHAHARASNTSPQEYRVSYKDVVDTTAILMQVSLDRMSRLVYSLSPDQQTEVERLVRLAQAVEQGDISISGLGGDVEEVILIDEPPAKKRRLQKTASEKLKAKAKKTLLKKSASKTKDKQSPKTLKKQAEPKRKKITKKEANLELHPRHDFVVLEDDPLFETRISMPSVSKVANSRLVFRAIHLKDNKMLTKLLKDGSNIYKLYTKSVDNMETPYQAAAKGKDPEILKTILQECLGSKFRDRTIYNREDPCRIDKLQTGRYNQRSLGLRFIRKITASRGSREGNNALTMGETQCDNSSSGVVMSLLKIGLDPAQLRALEGFNTKDYIYEHLLSINDVCDLLLAGQHQAAGQIIAIDLKRHWTKFNHLYRDVLLQSTGDLASCPPYACKCVNKRVNGLTPYHCAAASPYSQHLKKLLSVQPDVHVADTKGRRPIHYAAACSSPDTLKLLLEWGANTSDTDSARKIPLHYAIEANCPCNVKILLEHPKKGGVKDLFAEKYGVGGVNRQASNSMTPLHVAARKGFLEVAELLIKHGADLNAKLSVSENQLSPLMLAASSGHLDMARLLVKHGAVVEQQDRMGRTAVTYASKNGATSVLTYLIRLGARVNREDNSGNTPMHYAAAYGWLFTLRTLLDAGADLNVHNMWRTTPLSVAYLKSHYGIVQELLAHGKVDINFTDDDGLSLLFHACSSDLSQVDLCEQIIYMIEEKGASCTLVDNFNRSPLHHLTYAGASVDTDEGEDKQEEQKKRAYSQSVDIARLLLKHGCSLNTVDNYGDTAAMDAVGRVHNFPLIEFLLSQGGKLEVPAQVDEGIPLSTVMHDVASNMWDAPANLPGLIKLLKKYKGQVVKMCDQVDTDGYTPLLLACLEAREGQVNLQPMNAKSKRRVNPWIQVRQFINILVTEFQANPNTKVAKRYFSLDDMPSPNSPKWWHRRDLAEKTPAHIALYGNDPELNTDLTMIVSKNAGYIFKDLVRLGADLNIRDHEGLTPLGSCINTHRLDLLQFLKTELACNFNMPIKESKNDQIQEVSPLLLACRMSKQGYSGMINDLIDCGCDINARMAVTAMKCLHLLVANATEQSREDVLKVLDKLSEKGYDFDSQDSMRRTALHYAVRAHSGSMSASMELEVKLLQLGSAPGLQDSKGRTALHYVFKTKAAKRSWGNKPDPAEMAQLISRNMTKRQLDLRDKHGKTALHYAALKGASICCMYLTMIGADPNIKDNDGNTALSLAVQEKFDGCASNLIQGGASLKSKVITFSTKELQDRKQRKKGINNNEDLPLEKWMCYPATMVKEEEAVRKVPLYQAAVENKLNGVAMFVTGADASSSGLTPVEAIEITFKTCMYQTSLRLLHTNTDPTVLHQSLDSGRSFLHALAISSEESTVRRDPTLLKLGEWLINAGLGPDSVDKFSCTPVQYAILNRQFHLADLLAEKSGGYNVKYQDGMGRSHLAAVLWRRQSRGIGDADTWNFLKKLIENKVDLNQLFDLPLNHDLVDVNIHGTKLDPDYYTRYPSSRTTALITAFASDQFPLAKNLLNSGANPNAADGAGLTPLMHAIKMNRVNFVKLLLDYDFDPNKKEEIETKVARKVKKWNKDRGGFKLKAQSSIYDDNDSEEESTDDDEEEKQQTQTKKKTNKPEWLPVKQTSPVNLNQKDSEGRTALHYVARPRSLGTFDNGEMASLLIQNGAGLHSSKAGLTAHQEAVQAGAATVAGLLQDKFGSSAGRIKKLPSQLVSSFVEDGVPPIVGAWPDVSKAAHQMLRRYTSDMDRDTPTYVHTVDANCHVKNGELVRDEDLDRYFDVLMTKVDVKRGDWGLYNFYQIQLVYQPSKKLYILFTQWGRIEDDGQFQHTPFEDRDSAVKEFAKVFREKSGNKWADINRYEQKPRKYRLVEDVARQAPAPQKDVEIDLSSNVVSVMPHHLAKIVKTLMDPEAIQSSMNNIRGLDTNSLPFGQLNKERLLQGQRILQQIEKLVEEIETHKEKTRKNKEASAEDVEAYKQNLEKVADLSNDYYHVIPQSNFSCKKLRPLDERRRLQHQMYNISNLLHYQVTCRLVLAAMWYRREYNPVDFVYRSMGCKMQLMDQNDAMVQMILKYIWLSKDAGQSVHAIYKLERKGEKDGLKAQGERRLLFHGSRTCNVLSILHHGLVVSPPDAESSGCRFGKGIYFSDAFSYSASYSRSGKARFMLICEVAMGTVFDYAKKMKETDEDATLVPSVDLENKMADTVMVKGNFHFSPADWFILSSGERLPMGKGKYEYSRGGTSHTQYVVRNPSNVRLRYLIQFS